MADTNRALLLALCCITLLAAGCTGEIFDPHQTSGSNNGSDASDAGDTGLVPDSITDPNVDCDNTFDIGPSSIRRLTRTEYNNTIRDLLGDASNPADAFAEDEKVGGFNSNAVAPVSMLGVEQYQSAAHDIATRAVSDLSALLPCDPVALGEAECAAVFVADFGARAWRRALTPAEVTALVGVYDIIRADQSFEDAIRVVVQTLLQSPNFLYHIELGEPLADNPGIVRLTQYEVASRLSYFLWNTMPDQELLNAARNGALNTRADVERQARRLMSDERARDAIRNFHNQWLELEYFDSVHKNTDVYPAFDEQLRQDMLTETRTFIENVIFLEDGSVDTLFTANHSYINDNLAAVYGVEPPMSGDAFVRVEFDPSERSGLLTHASLLAMHAKPDQSSPVARGKFVRERFLCQHIPDPPIGLEVTPPPFDPTLTTRQRFAQHSEDAACASCHDLMDPIGFGFENYDGIGGFRTLDSGMPVDASGEFLHTEAIDGAFSGPMEMTQILADSDEVHQCMAEQWFRFALKRTIGGRDACSYQDAYDIFEDSGYNIREFMIGITLTDAFSHRRVGME